MPTLHRPPNLRRGCKNPLILLVVKELVPKKQFREWMSRCQVGGSRPPPDPPAMVVVVAEGLISFEVEVGGGLTITPSVVVFGESVRTIWLEVVFVG